MPSSRKRIPKLAAMTQRQREVYERALHTLSLSRRHGLPLKTAAHQAGTTEAAALRYAGSAFTRRHGAWVAKPRDTLERELLLYDPSGSFFVTVQSSATASRIGEFHSAVRHFVQTGDATRLRAFDGRFIIDAQGNRHKFLTDPKAILKLARAKEFGFTSIY